MNDCVYLADKRGVEEYDGCEADMKNQTPLMRIITAFRYLKSTLFCIYNIIYHYISIYMYLLLLPLTVPLLKS